MALADIAEQLNALLALAREEDSDPAKVHLALLALADRFGSLVDNAQAFMAPLRRTIDFQDGDEEAFIAYKDRLVEYIQRSIAYLANRGAQIADLLARLNARGVDHLLRTAALRQAGDAVPGGGPDAVEAVQREAVQNAAVPETAGPGAEQAGPGGGAEKAGEAAEVTGADSADDAAAGRPNEQQRPGRRRRGRR